MSKILDQVMEANRKYAAGFECMGKGGMPPARGFAILTCMDARMDPAKFCGLADGDAHVIRNAGGRASDDAIRSLAISAKLQGTREWFVIHHTNCGMLSFTNEIMRDLFAKSLGTAAMVDGVWKDPESGPGSRAAEYIEWLTIRDQKQGLIDDVERIKSHPLVPSEIPIYGYIFDVETGLLNEVAEASRRGAAAAA